MQGLNFVFYLKEREPNQEVPFRFVVRTQVALLVCAERYSKKKGRMLRIYCRHILSDCSLLLRRFSCPQEIPHNLEGGSLQNVFLRLWEKKNKASFDKMVSLSSNFWPPSSHFKHSVDIENSKAAFKFVDFKVASRGMVPMLMHVSGFESELILHFVALIDIVEHLEDQNGRDLTVMQVEQYLSYVAEDWFPEVRRLFRFFG